MSKPPYRNGVVLVLGNDDGTFLLGKRRGMNVWQFPQGGKEANETYEQTLFREAKEEIGFQGFKILKVSEHAVSYDFPSHLKAAISRDFIGQSQYWYHCRARESEGPDLEKASDQEFDELKWASITEVLEEVVNWKKEAYLMGLRYLGLL